MRKRAIGVAALTFGLLHRRPFGRKRLVPQNEAKRFLPSVLGVTRWARVPRTALVPI